MKDEIGPGGVHIREIATVLTGQHNELNRAEADLASLNLKTDAQNDAISALEERVRRLSVQAGVALSASGTHELPTAPAEPHSGERPTWTALVRMYADAPEAEYASLDALLDPQTVAGIDARFDARLRRSPWDKWDYTFVFGAALVGIIADWFCAPLGNPVSQLLESYGTQLHDNKGLEKGFRSLQQSLAESDLAKRFSWVRHIADMDVSHDNLAIDYQGQHYGGIHHRGLSAGHDLVRFLAAIWQIKNGTFVGTRFENGVRVMETFGSQAGGSQYAGTDWTTAAVEYLLHVAADFFTKTSIPVPGATLLRELPNREIRKFVQDMYEGPDGVRSREGYNLRHVVGQAVTPAVTSLVIWLYNLLRYRIPDWVSTHVKHEVVVPETVPGLKLSEMLAVSHVVVAGVNAGRVIITSNPFMLNLPEILTCAKCIYRLAMNTAKLYDIEARLERNRLVLDEGWVAVERFASQPVNVDAITWPEAPVIVG